MKTIFTSFVLALFLSCSEKASSIPIDRDIKGRYKITEAWFTSPNDSSRKPLSNFKSLNYQEIWIDKQGNYKVSGSGNILQQGQLSLIDSDSIRIDDQKGLYAIEPDGTIRCSFSDITEYGDTITFTLKPL